jgi:hypothetical protein
VLEGCSIRKGAEPGLKWTNGQHLAPIPSISGSGTFGTGPGTSRAFARVPAGRASGLLRPAGGGKRRVWKRRRSHGLRELGECCGQAERR